MMSGADGRELPHVDDDLAALGLDALDPGEREAIEFHVSSCSRCGDLLVEHRALAGRVRAAEAVVDAPDRVWEGIAAELHRSRRLRTEVPPRQWRGLWWGAAAAAALAIAAGAGWFAGNRTAGETTTPSDLVGVPTDDLVFTLLNLEPGSQATGRIFMSSDRARGMVVVTDLHRLDSERQWGVWVVLDDRTRKLMGTFGVDADGAAIVPLVFVGLPVDYETTSVGLAISPVSRLAPGQQAGPDVLVGPLY